MLHTPGRGVLIPPMVWASQFRYTGDAVLLVLHGSAHKARRVRCVSVMVYLGSCLKRV